MLLFFAFGSVTASAASSTNNVGKLTLSRNYATYGTEIDIAVTDLDLRESIARESETLDSAGEPFTIPAGGIGQTFELELPIGVIADQDRDGLISSADFSVSIPNAEVTDIDLASGTVTVTRTAASATDLTYSIETSELVTATEDPLLTPYVISPGLQGFSEFVMLPTVSPFDADDSGDVSIGDFTIVAPEISIAFLDISEEIAVVVRETKILTPLPFSIGYQTGVVYSEDVFGDPFVLPAADEFESFTMFLSNPPIADINGDGLVTGKDVSTSGLTGGKIGSVDVNSGAMSVARHGGIDLRETFSVTYATSIISTTSVEVLGTNSDSAITVILTETSPSSSRFVGKIMPVKNISGPETTSGTKIGVDHGDTIIVRYQDQTPRTIITDAITMDTIAPTITRITPIPGAYVFPRDVNISFTVDDVGIGVDTNDIEIHLDFDKDEVIVGDEEIFSVPVEDVTVLEKTLTVNTMMPDLGSDGTVSWFLRVTDRAGNTTRSDSDVSVAGNQDGRIVIDTRSARIISAVAGERFDDGTQKIETDQLGWVHLTFDEPIDPASLLPENFFIDNRQASTAFVPKSMPLSLFLNVPLLLGDPDELQMQSGAVHDLAGLESGLQTVSVTDLIRPRMAIALSSKYVSGMFDVEVTSNENLSASPSVSIDGRTVDVTPPEGDKKWRFQIDVNKLDSSRASDGVRNIVVTGFDRSGNLGTVGQETFEADYPSQAIRFEVDHQVSTPLISPTFGTKLEGWTTLIRISFPGESNEYEGDTSSGAVITSATINGTEVGHKFSPIAYGVVWEYQTDILPIGSYLVAIESADLAGNALTPVETIFTVSTQPPVDPSDTPSTDPSDGVDEEPPAVEVPVDGDPQSDPADGQTTPIEDNDVGVTLPKGDSPGSVGDDIPNAQVEAPDDTTGQIEPSDVAPDPDVTPNGDSKPIDPSTEVKEPTTASPSIPLAPGLAAIIEGVIAAQAALQATPPDVDPSAESTAEPADGPIIDAAPESTPDPSEAPPGLTNADVEQTATAMRDASLLEDETPDSQDGAPSGGGGCGLPFANSKTPGADSALYGAGLLGLLIVARRPKRNQNN